MNIKIVGFDADDTLWVNENYFREAEQDFCELLAKFCPARETLQQLYDHEMKTLNIYGFGIKGFMLSMVETAAHIMGEALDQRTTNAILSIGKEMLNKPVDLLEGVEDTLKALEGKYRLILITKGDLLDQQRKLERSGLEKYFHHVEVMSNKHEDDYKKLIRHLDHPAEEFLMIGNSLKSDILPVLNIGARAIYVPYEITWEHETVTSEELKNNSFPTVSKLTDVLEIL